MTGPDAGGVGLALDVGRPYSAAPLLAYLGARAIAGVEQVDRSCYRRSLRNGAKSGVLSVDFTAAESDGRVAISCSPDIGLDDAAVSAMVTNLADADAPAAAIADQLGDDPALGPLVRRHPGLRIPGTVAPFELAVRAVLGQQISVAAARTLAGRIASEWGCRAAANPDGLHLTFPGPEQLAEAPVERAGVSRGRANAIRSLAAAVASGQLGLEPGCPNPAAVEAKLLEIGGIGPWTAAYVCLRGLRSRDAIPVADLGLRQAIGCQRASEVAARAESWRPWRGYAAVHLWSTFLEG
jgi:AraC family transcriptional regulator of adaptative response / DNA-3-methyladenine glycosylase II